MKHERHLVGRGRTLEEATQHRDDDVALVEPGQDVAQTVRPLGRVELVAAFGETRGRPDIQVRTEGDHEEVAFVGPLIGDDPLVHRIDGAHRLLEEVDVRPGDVPVGEADPFSGLPSEHDVELREAEDEGVALVDQRDVHIVAKCLGEPSRQLEPSEAGPEDQDPGRHDRARSRRAANGHGQEQGEAQVIVARDHRTDTGGKRGAEPPPGGEAPPRRCDLSEAGPRPIMRERGPSATQLAHTRSRGPTRSRKDRRHAYRPERSHR